MLTSRQKITGITITLAVLLLASVLLITGQSQQPNVNSTGNESGGIAGTNQTLNQTVGSIRFAQPIWQCTFPIGDGVQAVSVDRVGDAIVVGTRFSDLYYFNRSGTVVKFHDGTRDPEMISIIRGNRESPYGVSGVAISAEGKYTGVVSATGQNAYYYQNGTPMLGNEWATVRSGGQNVATSDDGQYYVAGIGHGNNNNVLFCSVENLPDNKL